MTTTQDATDRPEAQTENGDREPSGGGSLRLELHHDAPDGETTISWDLETLTNGPGGSFFALDEDETPRLILDAATLMEIQRGAESEVGK